MAVGSGRGEREASSPRDGKDAPGPGVALCAGACSRPALVVASPEDPQPLMTRQATATVRAEMVLLLFPTRFLSCRVHRETGSNAAWFTHQPKLSTARTTVGARTTEQASIPAVTEACLKAVPQ
ncbi:hypothetical protein GCM10010103_76340 [Streptomyces paradoxus]